jgi:hypothetical protein
MQQAIQDFTDITDIPTGISLISCVLYSSTLKVEAKYSSETSASFQRIALRYIPVDVTLHTHWCENLESYIFLTALTARVAAESNFAIATLGTNRLA